MWTCVFMHAHVCVLVFCACVFLHTRACAHVFKCTHVCVHVCASALACVSMCAMHVCFVCMHERTHMYKRVSTCVYMQVYPCVLMHACVCVCAEACVHVYTLPLPVDDKASGTHTSPIPWPHLSLSALFPGSRCGAQITRGRSTEGVDQPALHSASVNCRAEVRIPPSVSPRPGGN